MRTEGPVLRLAQRRVIAASADIEAQLSVREGCRPVLIMLVTARQEAAEAMAELATIDLTAPISEIRRLQNEVRRFDDLMTWLRALVARGFEYDHEISEQERDELAAALSATPEGEAEAIELGLIERDEDASR